jgi:SAM-dependent methyltransferase
MLLYATTIFVSAFLLFQVQPIIAKIILPWFGGAAAVWTTCMLFFQTVLLAGYLYSHWTTERLASRAHATLHGLLLALSLLVLPIIPEESWKPSGSEDPILRILVLLCASIGLPYLLLSTTGPLLQAWFARAFPGRSPYRLFALSNAGSMFALLGYPFLVEPTIATRRQAAIWSAGYVVFVLLSAACAWRSRDLTTSGVHSPSPQSSADAPCWRLLLWWTSLPACASALLLAITNHLTQDVAPMPFLWVVPLALYLLSFILVFDSAGWYRRVFFLPLTAISLAAMTYMLRADMKFQTAPKIAVFCASLFICSMSCHGEAAALKPHPRYLTSFYLMISLGGAIGGMFIGVIAPYCFPLNLEFPIAMLVSAALILIAAHRDPSSALHRHRWSWLVGAAAVVVLGVVLAHQVRENSRSYRQIVRNFYGGLRTADYGSPQDHDWTRKLTHGAINHGEQYLQPERAREPTSYFGPSSGVGRAIKEKDRHKPQRIGITGLGAGVMLTYARPGDCYRIYEINPLVIDLARSEFTFLRDCPAKVELVLGDARLSLEREPPQQFDVLHMDAFSSDSVPVHLLTHEAFQLYFRHLKPDGVLVIHISNRYLTLEPVVAQAAARLGKHSLLVSDDGDDELGFFGTDMVLVTARKEFFERPAFQGFSPPKIKHTVALWTDDYSNLFRILK